MIEIAIQRTSAGIGAVAITGHAGYAESGRDIVCAAVSGITLTAALGIMAYGAGCWRVEQEEGWLRMTATAPPAYQDPAQIILNTMVLGLREVCRLYPRRVIICEHQPQTASED